MRACEDAKGHVNFWTGQMDETIRWDHQVSAVESTTKVVNGNAMEYVGVKLKHP